MKQLEDRSVARHLYVIDALRYSFMLENKAYNSLTRALRIIEKRDFRDGGHPKEELALIDIGAAWEMLDIIHRIRGLITQVPKLSQKSPDIQLFLRNNEKSEGFRNIFQHLNSHISKIDGGTNPIMGALSWLTDDPDLAITIMMGTSAEDTSFHTLAFDTSIGQFTSKLQLTAGNMDIELYDHHNRCAKLSAFFTEWLACNNFLSAKEQKVGIVRFASKPTP